MVINLTGIVEDGNTPSRGLPASSRRTLAIPRGASTTVKLKVRYRSGPTVDVGSLDAAVLSIRARMQDPPIIARAVYPSPIGGPGYYELSLTPADYQTLDPGGAGKRLLYDVWLARFTGERDPVIPTGALVILPSANNGDFSFMEPPEMPASGNTGVYGTDSFTLVNHAVFLSAPDSALRADADDATKQPLIGFVQSKPSPTQAVVQYSGELSGFSGLTPNATYFLSTTPGQITDNVSGYPIGAIVQKVGFAKDSTTLVIMVDRDYVVL